MDNLNSNKQDGMTLLEVLVATSLMAVISVISYTGLNGLIDSKIHTDKVAETLNREVITSRQLLKDINSIIDRDIKTATGEVRSGVLGSYFSIELSVNGHSNPLNQHRSDLQRVKWQYVNGELIRSSLDYLETGTAPRWKDRVYLSNLKDFNISYVNNAGKKIRKWPESAQFPIPKIIQFNIVLQDNNNLELHLIPNGVLK
jgi:general secretion pathway protein J